MENTGKKHNIKWLPPETILDQRYEITDVLGDGGFGITYSAVHRNMKKSVAIKEFFCSDYMMRDARVSADIRLIDPADKPKYTHALEKFLFEAQVLSSVSGIRGVVHVTDYFQENKTAYIVMDLVEGVSLGSMLQKETRYNWDDLIRKMLPLIESLSTVHKKDLIHRDIKPDNILVSEDGSFTLVDFGSAIRYKGEETHSVYLSEGYAPKEQYLRSGRLGPYTDIYSLCAVMYHCLTGKVPEHSVQRAVFDELRKPSDTGVHIPAELENILMKGLAVEPESRWQEMSELYEALSALLPGQKKPRRLLFVALGIASTLFLLTFAYIFLNYSNIRIRQEIANGENITFELHAPDTMSPKDFDAASEIIESRSNMLFGKHHYLEEKSASVVSITVPEKYFPETQSLNSQDILYYCLAFAGNWELHNPEKTKYYTMNSENVEDVRLEYGHLPIISYAQDSSFSEHMDPIDWSLEEESYYLEITFDPETASFLADFLSEPGYIFYVWAIFENDDNDYMTRWVAKGDGKTAYYRLGLSEAENVAETFKMLFDSDGYSESLLLAGTREPTQLMKDDAPVIELTRDINRGTQLETYSERSRTMLELLEIPYETEQSSDYFTVRVPANKVNRLILESLLENSCSITTAWDDAVCYKSEITRAEVVEAEDGFDLDVYLSDSGTSSLTDLMNPDENGISSDVFYLYINHIRTGILKSTDPDNNRSTFHLFLPETEPGTVSNSKLAEYIAYMISLPEITGSGYQKYRWYDAYGKEIIGKDIPELTIGTDSDRFSSLYQEIEDLGGTVTHSLDLSEETLEITFDNWAGDFPGGALQMIESLYTSLNMDENICHKITFRIKSWYHGEPVRITASFSAEPASKSVICSSGTVSCTDETVLKRAEEYIEKSPILHADESRFPDGKPSPSTTYISNPEWRYTSSY